MHAAPTTRAASPCTRRAVPSTASCCWHRARCRCRRRTVAPSRKWRACARASSSARRVCTALSAPGCVRSPARTASASRSRRTRCASGSRRALRSRARSVSRSRCAAVRWRRCAPRRRSPPRRRLRLRPPASPRPTPESGDGRGVVARSGQPAFFSTGTMVISTRRFCARPSGVSLVSTGWSGPAPTEIMRSGATPLLER